MNHIEQKLDFLRRVEESEEPLQAEETVYLIELLSAKNADVRCRAAISAGICFLPEFEKPLLQLLKDKKRIIRVNACDSLSNSANMAVASELCPLMKSGHRLERAYSVLSYSDIAVNAGAPKEQSINVLRPYMEAEKDDWAKAFGVEALAQLGDYGALEHLYRLIGSKDAHARRAALKCAARFVAYMDRDMLETTLIRQLEQERDETIKQHIKSLLEQIRTLNEHET